MALNNPYCNGQYLYPQQLYRYEPQMNNQQANFSLKGRPVESIDEARASLQEYLDWERKTKELIELESVGYNSVYI